MLARQIVSFCLYETQNSVEVMGTSCQGQVQQLELW